MSSEYTQYREICNNNIHVLTTPGIWWSRELFEPIIVIRLRYECILSEQFVARKWEIAQLSVKKTEKTRQSEMANTSPRHMPVIGNVHPIKIENFDIFSWRHFSARSSFYIFNW